MEVMEGEPRRTVTLIAAECVETVVTAAGHGRLTLIHVCTAAPHRTGLLQLTHYTHSITVLLLAQMNTLLMCQTVSKT